MCYFAMTSGTNIRGITCKAWNYRGLHLNSHTGTLYSLPRLQLFLQLLCFFKKINSYSHSAYTINV